MVRNSLKYVSWKDYKAVTSGLKMVYQAPTEEAALMALDKFAEAWDDKYPQISKSWRTHWENLNTFFGYPPDIRKAIYTTNAIESVNSVIRAAIKKAQSVPDRRLSAEGCLFGDQGCIKKMEYADPELAVSDEPFYYRVR
ncbi:putative transposase [Yersinia pestis]|uniref:Mutator family transposase n=2 Tax=Yersinia pestis TaxID=632 RepID=A0AAX2I223_YERPE|nr:putative transposase [Yersinia pestis]